MEYEEQIQHNRIEGKIDALIRKLCPELLEEPKEEE
jgi:hypothetical protein